MVKSLQQTKYSVDEKLDKSFITLFGKKPNSSAEVPGSVEAHDVADREVPFEPVEQYHSEIKDEDDELDEDSDTEGEDGLESSDGEKKASRKLASRTIDDSSDDETVYASGKDSPTQSDVKEQTDFHDGRVRRRAVFENEMDTDGLKVILLQVSHIHPSICFHLASHIT